MSNLIASFLVSFVAAVILYKLLSPTEPAKSEHDFGRYGSAWAIGSAVLLFGTRYLRHNFDTNYLVQLLLVSAVAGPVAYGIGWAYWKVFHNDKQDLTTPIKSCVTTPEIGDQFYEVAWLEINANKVEKGLWAHVFADTEGDIEKSKALYIKTRAQQLYAAKERKAREEALRQAAIKRLDEEKADRQIQIELQYELDFLRKAHRKKINRLLVVVFVGCVFIIIIAQYFNMKG